MTPITLEDERLAAEDAREFERLELRIGTAAHPRERRGGAPRGAAAAQLGPVPAPGRGDPELKSDEVSLNGPCGARSATSTSDAPLPGDGVACYSLTELFGEKLRALSERCRPRDLYDVVHMHRHPDLIGRPPAVASVLARTCAHAGISVRNADTIRSSPYREEIERE